MRRWIAGVVIVVLAVACDGSDADEGGDSATSTTDETTATSSPGVSSLAADDVDSLVRALEALGASVTRGEMISGTPFDVLAEILCVEQAPVRVWEFPDPELRLAAASTISRDGSHAGSAIVEWVSPAHFYAEGRVIVLYLGTDIGLQEKLTTILGSTLTPEASEREDLAVSTRCALERG